MIKTHRMRAMSDPSDKDDKMSLIVLIIIGLSVICLKKQQFDVVEPTENIGYYPISRYLVRTPTNKPKLCFVLPAFTLHGGIEAWFKTLHNMMRDFDMIDTYGLYIWDIRTKVIWRYSLDNDLFVIHSVYEVENQCHIVIGTAFRPIKNVVNILAIHGGAGCKWTQKYSSHSKLYDIVIGVSIDSKFNTAEEEQSRVITIPSYVYKLDNCDHNNKYKLCEKQLLFVGRISSEKRPKLFCEVVCKMDEYCGVVIGPSYFTGNNFECKCSNVYYLGARDDAQCYMRESLAQLIPSESEGGPIVAIEAWLNNLPVIMKSTGLAKQFPSAFIEFDWDNPQIDKLHRILENDLILNESKRNGYQTYIKHFSKEVLMKLWLNVVNTSLMIIRERKWLVDIDLISDVLSTTRFLGKSIIVDCMDKGCRSTIRFNTKVDVFCFRYSSAGPDNNLKFSVSSTLELKIVVSSEARRRICTRIMMNTYFHLDIDLGYNQVELNNFEQE